MRNTSFLPIRAMTKEDVLNTIRDSYRFAQKLDPEAEPGYDLTFDTTIEDWRTACDLLPAKELGHALNVWFGVYFSDIDWMATLEPAKTATLGGVCELVASNAKMPDIKEFPVFGTECLSAGVFLTIRTALAKEGVPVEGICPSTALEPIARKHLGPLIQTVGSIAPDVLPVPEMPYRRSYKVCWLMFLVGVLMMFLSGVFSTKPVWMGIGFAVAVTGFAAAVVFGLFHQSFERVSFPGMKTFRDLTEAIIRRTHEPRNP
jgi:hypothetical protein